MPRPSWPIYGLVGAGATACHWLLLTLLVEAAGWQAAWASGAGALLGAQVAFAGNRYFTFRHRGPLWSAWRRFQLTALTGALLGMLIVALVTVIGWHYLIAQAIATAVVLVLGYLVNRAWSFAA